MKKYLILISLLSTIFSCNTETIPQIKQSSNSLLKDAIATNPKPQESNTPVTIIKTPTPTPSPTEKADFSKLDVYGEGIYCEDRNKIVKAGIVDVKLDKPVNIAVTKDGSVVYVVNGTCGRKPYLRHISEYHDSSDLCDSDDIKQTLDAPNHFVPNIINDIDRDIVKNNLIIKISKDGKKQAIIGDNTGVFFCSNDGVIALDENDNLYFSANRRIYKVKDDKYVELVANLDELEKGNDSLYPSGMIAGLAVRKGDIYVDVRDSKIPKRYIPRTEEATLCFGFCGEGEETNVIGEIKEIKNGRLTNLFLTRTKYKSKFFLYENSIFNLQTFIKEKDFKNADKKLFQENPVFSFNKIEYNSSSSNHTSFESDGEVAQLNLDTNSWYSPYGYDYLYFYNDVTSIITNSKKELFYITYNNLFRRADFNKRYSYLFVGDEDFIKSKGYKDGKAEESLFNKPAGMAIDANDNIYVADTGNNAIRKITPDGTVSTFYKE
jgi:hypothetical protein